MRSAHVLLAVAIAVVWGVAFVFTKLALESFSPPLLTALRFSVSALPALFLARPALSWRLMAGLGLTLFLGQFLFQFFGIAQGVPAGLAAVIVQSQALLTVALAFLLLRERPARRQIVALSVAALGLACIAGTVGQEFSVAALLLIFVSPLSFAVGNILLRRADTSDMLGLMSWLSLVPPLPSLLLAVGSDGAGEVWRALTDASWLAWLSVIYLGLAATTFGYAAWGHLLRLYPAASVVPFALLVPFVGAAASTVVFGETFGALRLAGIAFVLLALAILWLPLASRRTGGRDPLSPRDR